MQKTNTAQKIHQLKSGRKKFKRKLASKLKAKARRSLTY
jgi:hypothetical protein|tara:strand:+ start:43 stop:159 length:117 start_codon:yes stop_codon:yes gene_type:complete